MFSDYDVFKYLDSENIVTIEIWLKMYQEYFYTKLIW